MAYKTSRKISLLCNLGGVKLLFLRQETHTQNVNNTEIVLDPGVQYKNSIAGERFEPLSSPLHPSILPLGYLMVDKVYLFNLIMVLSQ